MIKKKENGKLGVEGSIKAINKKTNIDSGVKDNIEKNKSIDLNVKEGVRKRKALIQMSEAALISKTKRI